MSFSAKIAEHTLDPDPEPEPEPDPEPEPLALDLVAGAAVVAGSRLRLPIADFEFLVPEAHLQPKQFAP